MGYPLAPAAPPNQRPGAVTAAGYLLYAVAALLVLSQVISLLTLGKAVDAVTNAYAGTSNLHVAQTAVRVGIIAGVVIDVLLVALLVVLAVFDLRGRNGMRITTWVIAGLGVLCLACGAFGNTTGSTFESSAGQTNGVTVNLHDVVPAWARTAELICSVASVIALILVIILLALPASNAFFRKPPMMVVGYPQGPGGYGQPMPGYPPYQGYPPTGDPAYPPVPQYPQEQPPTMQDPQNPFQPPS